MQQRSTGSWIVRILSCLSFALMLMPVAEGLRAQSDGDFDHGVIAYSKTTPTDPVARLQRRVDSGELTLEFEPSLGYLPAILRALNIPTSSQSLVFSKTSFQFTQIAPGRPRALYFNDDVYVGYVQGSQTLEFAASDPKLGAVFYTLEEDEKVQPRFQREIYFCLICHESSTITGGVPGFMTVSVLPEKEGNAIRSAPAFAMSDQTPFSERWGGWYVTGTHGTQRHRGNTVFSLNAPSMLSRMDWSKGANRTTLDEQVDTSRYLTPHSDIVALIALNHQTRIHNLITRANYETLRAIEHEKPYGETQPGEPYSSITMERIRASVDPLVRGMFFVNEAPLTDSVRGVSGFTADFEKSGVRDSRGRSLKDLDLKRRFLRYPLSYLIYSDAFDALPGPAKDYFYERARNILSGAADITEFRHLSAEDRAAIREILEDTKPDFVRSVRK